MFNNSKLETPAKGEARQRRRNSRVVYADHSATTPVRPEVVEVMTKFLRDDFGNPSSIHGFGRKAKAYLDEARTNISSVINAKEEEIIFTSGGTESNNLVVQGIARLQEENRLKDKHIISTKIEHSAVKEPLEYLEKRGWKITWLNVDKEGFIDLEELKSKINTEVALVSIIHANNEIGTIQDLKKISTICNENNVLFHSDVVQSFGKILIDVKDLNIDFMSMSGHKIYGPKGIGALYIKSKSKISPLLIGGGQECNLRSGTENLPGIVGFGVAAKILKSEILENAIKLRNLQMELLGGLLKIKDVILTGPSLVETRSTASLLHRIPGHVSICVKSIEGESLVLQMDLKGIAVSSGSACKSKGAVNRVSIFEPSHVLMACGVPDDYVKGSLRLTLGKDNNSEDVDYIIESLKNICETFSFNLKVAH